MEGTPVTRPMRIEDLADIAVPEQPVLSPDGTRIVYVLRTSDVEADRTVRELWHVPVADGPARRLTRGGADQAPSWSPDGTRIAFLRAPGGQDGPGGPQVAAGSAQLWQLPADGGEAGRLTSLPLGAGAPVWSPDGTHIAFTAPVDIAPAPAGPAAARAPIVADRLDYQADGAGLFGSVRRHLHVLDLATGDCRQVTGGAWHAGQPAWSPDSRTLAFTAATDPRSDLTVRAAAYTVDALAAGAAPVRVGSADGYAATASWTPDGAALLVVGYPAAPVGHARLLRVPLDGGPATDLTGALDRNVMPGGPGYPGGLPQPADDAGSVLFCVRDRGCTHLYATGPGSDPRPVVAGAGRNVSGLSVARGSAVIVLATPTSFGEIATVDPATGAQTVRTRHGAALDGTTLYPRTEREFTVSDGTEVQGWLIRDPATTGPGPLLLDIHGGPHNAWNGAADDTHLYHQRLAALGWTVLLLNPRGSDGYGEDFFTAAQGAWGVADAADFLEPVDTLVAEGLADPARLAVAGYSYGGYMTCYLTSRDQRFAAAVAGGPVSDLVSMAGASDDGHFLADLELSGTPWAEPEQYAVMSPLSRVGDVRTPTLILHGAADRRCPADQAAQWHTALREREVPTRLVLYPGASHLFILDGAPSHRLDFNHRIVEWVERYAGSPAGPRPAPVDAAHWQRRLDALAARHRVPGAVLGILRIGEDRDDELTEAAYGVLSKDTGVSVTTDSLFQIGSITKVWTATVVMRLVDDGLLDLDAPLVTVLPELRLSDPDVTKEVTMRHLLTHTSGIDGDIFDDTGRGDDCLEKYAALLGEAAQIHPLGATWSYCNSGFALMGRVIEKLTDSTWDKALRDLLLDPLGLRHTVTLPEEALLHRAATGHIAESGAEPATAPVWGLPRSIGPAGLICSSAADVMAFARMHLRGGTAADGTRVIGEAATAAMADRQVELPDTHTLGDSWGLGWCRFTWDGRQLIGHDGNTLGQSAFLRLLPDQGLAVTLLTNGGNGRDLYQDLYREIFAELAELDMPSPLEPPERPPAVDITRHVGVYERAGVRIDVLERDGGARLRTTITGPLADLLPEPVEEYPMIPVDGSGDLYAVRAPDSLTWMPVMFYELPGGERYLHHGVRATPKARRP
jgi:dipeptidyl aminopeptidase/acylaminoacyl peptidase/CubicO group peptidase (beta-lactamase class C family)